MQNHIYIPHCIFGVIFWSFNMFQDDNKNSKSFRTGESAQERGLSYVPDRYVIPAPHRPSLTPDAANVPVIDLSSLTARHAPEQRSALVNQIGDACRTVGFFKIINHGISQSTLDGAMSAASDFFNLPSAEKLKFMSDDVHKPVRYGTSLRDGVDKIQFWRVFLKHYAHPLENWIDSWPQNPPNYRDDMGKYCKEVRNLSLELTGAIMESLGLGASATSVSKKLERGMQVMAVNGYPPCPRPETALGLPAHSDYGFITILLQSSPGLEIVDSEDGKWKLVPKMEGSLEVHVGDHLEILSNGLYKSLLHRATLNSQRTRISIASLHSYGMDEKMEPAEELVDEQHPKGYMESSFGDFLRFLSRNDLGDGKRFIETLKIKN